MIEKKEVTKGIRFSFAEEITIEEEARKRGLSFSGLIRFALFEYLRRENENEKKY